MPRALLHHNQPPPPGALVPDDRPCMSCGYNIRGLPADSNCPECATPLARSLRGDLLKYAGPAYLRTLRRGGAVVYWTLLSLPIVFIAISVASVFFPPRGRAGVSMQGSIQGQPAPLGAAVGAALGSAVSAALLLAPLACLLIGWWLLTSADPARRDGERALSARRVARAGLLAAIALYAAQVGVGVAGAAWPLTSFALGAASMLLLAAALLAGVAHIHSFAARIPDRLLDRRAGLVSVLAWVVVTGIVCSLLLTAGASALGSPASLAAGLASVAILPTSCATLAAGALTYIVFLMLLFRLNDRLARVISVSAPGASALPTPPAAGARRTERPSQP